MVGSMTLSGGSVNALPQPKKKYTYDDFTKDVESAGLTGSFSDADLDLARNNPEAGKKIMGFKIDYNNATTDEARATANASANAVRREGAQYHGGVDGLGTEKVPGTAQPGYSDLSKDEEYIAKRNELMAPREEFSYDADKDERMKNYERQYKSAMELAGSDALARTAAASGGRISSAAARAVTQAEAEYMAALADKTVELEEDAYSRWLTEQQLKQQDLENLRKAAAEDYERKYNEREYTDSRNDTAWEQEYKGKVFDADQAALAWEQGYKDKVFDADQAALAWEQGYKGKMFDADQAALAWEQGYKDKVFDADQAALAWEQGYKDWQNRWNIARVRAELGDYGKLNEITDATFAPQYSEEAKTTVQKLLDLGYTYEQIKALAGM